MHVKQQQGIVVGIVLLLVSFAMFVAAAFATFSMGLYADATGTGGYIPAVSWLTGVLGLICLVAGVGLLSRWLRRDSN